MPDVDPDSAFVQNWLTGVRAATSQGIDTSPDEAARVVQLRAATGVPAQVIQPDVQGFDKDTQANMAMGVVMGNPHLMSYVSADPMAASVSSDDWGTLDQISKSSTALGTVYRALNLPYRTVGAGIEGAVEGAKQDFGAWPTLPAQPTAAGSLVASAGVLAGVLQQGMSTMFGGIVGGIKGAATEVGGEKFGREAGALGEYQMLRPGEATGGMHMELGPEPPGSPWAKALEEPPAGIHPEIDQVKANLNAQAVDQLQDLIKNVQTSATKERSPEMFRLFMEQHPELRGGSIGINGDAARLLYGDKPPSSDDGLLGWVPGIADKLELAAKTGADVEVPLTDWITQVDPAVAKELRDNIRMWPGGLTGEEAKVTAGEMPPASDLEQVRQAAGTNPLPQTETILPAPTGVTEEEFANLQASGVGLDLKSWRKIQEDLAERQRDDLAKAQAFAETEQKRRQSQEWKDNLEAMLPDVGAAVRARPEVSADLLVGSGEINGQKVRQRIPLLESDLTREQQASLPDHYVSKTGVPIDEVARLTGHASGDEMVARLSAYNATKAEGDSPQVHLQKLITSEANAAMEALHGKLAQNVLRAAKDQALSEATLNLLTDEYLAAALKAGVTAVDKDVVTADAKDAVGRMTLAEVNSDKALALIGKNYRDAVRALIAEKPEEAIQHLERRTRNAFITKEMMKVERREVQFDRLTKTLSKLPEKSGAFSRDPDYLNYMHQIMIQVGKPVARRSVQGIQADIDARGTGTLQEFTDAKSGQLRTMPVWDQLFDPKWKQDYKTLSVDDFSALHDTLKAMDFNARDELKIIKAGEAVDLVTLKDTLKASVQRFKEKAYDANGNRLGFAGALRIPRTFLAKTLQMENLLNHWDHFDQWGAWNQSFMRMLIEGDNQTARWEKEYVAELRKLDDKADLTKSVANPIFRNPLVEAGRGELLAFNRENLRRILLDAGNSSGPRSNLFKRAKGYGLDPEEVLGWLHAHATKEDWDWAQGVWDMWGTIKDKGDTMFRSMTGGVAPDMVKTTPITVTFKDGTTKTYKGGYYPTNDYHPTFRGDSAKLSGKDSLLQPDFVSATSMPGWTQTRTGYAAPLRNDLSNMANLMKQHLHDIAMRPALVNASKIGFDKSVLNAITLHIGKEYADLIRPYLLGLANRTSYATLHPDYANSLAEKIRQNLVTTLVGLNPGTVLKHAPTAFVMSIKEVGPERYLKATRAQFGINDVTGDSNKKFADDNSLELNRRSRNWQETLYGEMANQTGGSKYETLRQEVARLSSKPVAMSDMLSARPTWLAGYEKGMEERGNHGDAVYAGDRAVRRAHGSTASTNRPAIMRDANPWFTSVYNFFNDIMNRQLETLWRAGEMTGQAKEGNWAGAAKLIPGITAGVFAYAIWPAIVEQLVSPEKSDPQESWGRKILHGLIHTESATLPYVRDLANFLAGGGEASLGLVTTGMKELGNVWQDAKKRQPFSPAHAQRMIHDWTGLTGMLTGMTPQAVGNVGGFGYGVEHGVEHPKGPWSWLAGMRYGTLKGHSSTLQNYLQGKSY